MINAISIKNELDFKKLKDNYIKEPFKFGIYILTGKERLFKKTFIAAMHSSVFKDDGESEMNYNVFYDKNDAIGYSPLEIADTPPLGSQVRVIVIYKYNNFQDDFIDYCSNPSKSSILILETENSLEEDSIYKYFSKKQDYILTSLISYVIIDNRVISPCNKELRDMAKIMTVRPPEELHQIIKKSAKRKGYTVNQLVLQILWAWTKEQKQ